MADEFMKAALYWIKTFNKKAKEKIWMIKLIELLNEYDGKNHWWDYDEEYLTSEEFYGENWDLEIISKKFWFIKWLVENDKIDFDKVCNSENYYAVDVWDNTDELLMLLAIQDEPIRFLCEIIK